jgi:hypothetical protein
MSRLINADKLKKDVLDLPDCYNGLSDTYDKACIIGVIDEQPTIEERKKVSDEEWTKARGGWTNQPERKTGKWEEREVSSEQAIEEWQSARCSVCGLYHTTPHLYYFKHYNYCPNCGSYIGGDKE